MKALGSLWQAVHRLLWAAAFLGSSLAILLWISPLTTATTAGTIERIGAGHPTAPAPYRGAPEYGYDLIFRTVEHACAFRYWVMANDARTAEAALAPGDRVSLRYRVSSKTFIEGFIARDCLTGKPIPGIEPRMLMGADAGYARIEVLDLWKDGALVLAWLPSWLPWLVGAVLLFVPGILILLAPLIDRYTVRSRRRPGMRELLKYDRKRESRLID